MINKVSRNDRAKDICGKRNLINGICIDTPCELGYICPICKRSDKLHWSEYRTFLWCEKCNLDIPSCMCKKDIKEGIEVYLDSIKDMKKRERRRWK